MTLDEGGPRPNAPAASAPGGPAPGYGPLPTLPAPSVAHIFGRALHRAVVGDPVQSLLVPFLLFLPWTILDNVLPEMRWEDAQPATVALWAASAVGGLLTTLIVSAMLRVRLAAAFAALEQRALDSYARALERTPALLLTEILRTLAVSAAMVFFIVPGIILGYRLSVATEAVVLTEPHMAAAFQRSFALTARRFSSWLTMLLVTLAAWILVLGPATALYMLLGLAWPEIPTSLVFSPCLPLLLAVVQYAWTLYFMELRARTVRPAVIPGGGAGRSVVPEEPGVVPPSAPDSMPVTAPPGGVTPAETPIPGADPPILEGGSSVPTPRPSALAAGGWPGDPAEPGPPRP